MSELELIRLLIGTPLLGWMLGWLAWRLESGRWRMEEGSLFAAERVFLNIFVSLVISAGLATLLAELGIFSLAPLLAGLALTCLVLLWKTGIGYWVLGIGHWKKSPIPNTQYPIPSIQSLFSPWTFGLLAILVLASVLFFRPAEAVLVMDDAGVYAIHGLTLARTGGLDIRDPLPPLPVFDSSRAITPLRAL